MILAIHWNICIVLHHRMSVHLNSFQWYKILNFIYLSILNFLNNRVKFTSCIKSWEDRVYLSELPVQETVVSWYQTSHWRHLTVPSRWMAARWDTHAGMAISLAEWRRVSFFPATDTGGRGSSTTVRVSAAKTAQVSSHVYFLLPRNKSSECDIPWRYFSRVIC